MAETWKPIFATNYEVSDLGRVRNTLTGRVLAPRRHTNGYVRVCLGADREEYVHRLVCAAFHGPSPNLGWHCDHRNKQRDDNRASNLCWLSPDENRKQRTFHRGQTNSSAKLNEDQVRQIRAGPFFRGRDRVLAQNFGVSRETIRDARLGKIWSHL